jgi:AraC-like DNA-binding protein
MTIRPVACPLYYPIQSIRLHARRFTRGYAFPPHVQPFHQFYCVLAGQITQRVETTRHRLSAGHAVWIAPGLEREPRAVSKTGEYLVIEFTAPWPQLGANTGTRCTLDAASLASARALAALQSVAEDSQPASILFHHLCLQLLPAAWFTTAAPSPSSAKTSVARAPDTARLDRIEQVLAANTGNPLRLEDIASLAGMSRSALGRLFLTHRGQSPCARFRELRLERARRLLARGERTVTEIALETGFASSQHFAGVFGRKYGSPPSDFLGRPE